MKTTVAFKIGRGGRFHAAGHLTYLGERKIGEFTETLFLEYEYMRAFKFRYGYDRIRELANKEDWDTLETEFNIDPGMLGELVYHSDSGEPVGLSAEEEESGIGRINIDGDYDTVYTKYLEDCTEEELSLIQNH